MLEPATRQHAAPAVNRRASRWRRRRWPRRPARRRPISRRWKTSSSWSASTSPPMRRRPQAAISDPVARKLAEWMILRSDDNGAIGRALSRLHLGQSELAVADLPAPAHRGGAVGRQARRRHGAGHGSRTKRRSRPRASSRWRGRCSRAATGANAERLVRDAWRSDSMSEDTESAALDLFGALLTRAAITRRGWTVSLYGSEHEAALRAAKRLGAGHVALAKARIAAYTKASNAKALLDAVPHELHGDPGYIFAQDPVAPPRGEIRRGRAADAERAEGSRPAAQSRRMVDRAAAAGAQDARRRRTPHRLSDRARRGAAGPRHLQDRAGIHRRLDRAALSERSGDGRAAFRPHRRRQRQPDRAGARRLLAGPRRRSRRPRAGGPRRLRRARPSNRPAITASWRAPSSACRRSN